MSEQVLSEILAELKGLKSGQNELGQRFTKIEEKVTSLDTKVENIEKKVNDLKTKVINLEGKITNLELKVTNLEEISMLLKKETFQLNQKADKLDDKINAVYGQVADLTEFKTLTINYLDELKDNYSTVLELLGEHSVTIRRLSKKIKLQQIKI